MTESGEMSFDGSQYMKRLADRERPMPRDSPLLIQVANSIIISNAYKAWSLVIVIIFSKSSHFYSSAHAAKASSTLGGQI